MQGKFAAGDVEQNRAVRERGHARAQHARVTIQLDRKTQPMQLPPDSRAPREEHGRNGCEGQQPRVAGTRVVCNARGYAKDGVNENPAFDANLRVEIDSNM